MEQTHPSDLSKKEILFTLFTSTFYISAFTIGGGYVIVPLLQEKFANDLGWIDEEEMLNFVAIGQSSPGPIAVNTAILIGYKMAGSLGAMVATLGTVLPPLIIITIVSFFYEFLKDNKIFNFILKGMQAGVAAVIVHTVQGMIKNTVAQKNNFYNMIMVVAFALVFFAKVNVVFIILGCIALAILTTIYITYKNPHDKNELNGGDKQ